MTERVDPFRIEPFRMEPFRLGPAFSDQGAEHPIVLPGFAIPERVILPLGPDLPFNLEGALMPSSLPSFDRERLGTTWLWLKLAAITVLIVLVETSQWIWSKARGKL